MTPRIALLLPLLFACGADDPAKAEDLDGDGFATGADCNDSDAQVYPGATEYCNSIDDDCDGDVDEEAQGGEVFYKDNDSDGVGNSETTSVACAPPEGFVTDGGDCDDNNGDAYPGNTEICGDGVDNDCSDGDSACISTEPPFASPASASSAPATYTSVGIGTDPKRSVRILGDMDSDGLDDIAVGSAFGANLSGGNNAGRSALVHGEDPPIGDHNMGAETLFFGGANERSGAAVAGADLDDDNRADLVITAPRTSADGANGGSVYVFYGNNTRLSGTYDLNLDAPARIDGGTDNQLFGTIAVAPGDLDDDGRADVLIGSPVGTPFGEDRGEVWFLYGGSRLPAQTPSAFLPSLTGDVDEQLGDGESLSAGDLDGDGLSDIVMGTTSASGDRVYLIYGDANQFSGRQPIANVASATFTSAAFDPASQEGFGSALAIIPDTDGDGFDELVLGAPFEDGGNAGSGMAFLIQGSPSRLIGETDMAAATTEFIGDNFGDEFGTSVAGGDLDDEIPF